MDQVQLQASKLLELLFSKETAATYQKTLNLTGTILKETAQLIWLIICSAFVFGAWVGDTSMKTGSNLRQWIDQQSNPSLAPAEKKPLAETGKSLLDQGRTSIDYLLNQAREQLGLEPEAPAPTKTLAQAPTAQAPTAQASTAQAPTSKDPVTPIASSKPAPTPASPSPSASAPTPDAAISRQATARPVPNSEVSRESGDGDWPPQAADD